MSVRSSDTTELTDPAAQEMAALRHVARVAARGASITELFAAAAEQIVQALDLPSTSVDRFDPDGKSMVVAVLGAPGFEPGVAWPVDGPCLAGSIMETAAPARIDDYSELPGTMAAIARAGGIRSSAGA